MFKSMCPYPEGTSDHQVWVEGAASGAFSDGVLSVWEMLESISDAERKPRFDRLSHGQLRIRVRKNGYPFIRAAMECLEQAGAVDVGFATNGGKRGRRTCVYEFTGKPFPSMDEVMEAIVRAFTEGRCSFLDDAYLWPGMDAFRKGQTKPKSEPEPEAAPAA